MKTVEIQQNSNRIVVDGYDLTASMPLTDMIRKARKTLRVFTFTISALFVNALVAPDVWAIQDGLEKKRQAEQIILSGSPEQQFNQALLKLQSVAGDKQQVISDRLENESGILDAVLSFLGLSQLALEDVDQLEQLYTLLEERHAKAVEGFALTKASLLEKELPVEIIDRHDAMVTEYQAQYYDMISRLANALAAGDLREQGEALDELHGMMKDQKLKRTHQSVDPENLPWSAPDADKVRKPAKTSEELNELTGLKHVRQGVAIAANEFPSELLGEPGGPTAEDLAPTVDVQITDAIIAKAEELENDPLKIYTWVRNNIEFIPSYGSIQGAEYTLQSGKGNAFDTASLTIALLRAANIPARYAYGTVEIPVEKAMNWVGGVEVPAAAQQLLGQGGIPNVGINVGGKVEFIEMEHVWVEAWVDYFPSRGAKHQIGDSWIPMDASFKQYEFTEGVDLQNDVPFDAEALVEEITAGAEVNEDEGYVTGIDQAALEQALRNYQTQIEEHINNQNPEATVGDVLGTQKIILKEYPTLAAGLPYQVSARAQSYSEFPSSLRHKFRYTLAEAGLYGFPGSQLLKLEESLPALAGKKLALAFKPATEADEQTLLSYLPAPDENGEIDPAALPTSLPGHLIRMQAQFLIDGQEVLSEAAGNMGGELKENLALYHPTFGWSGSDNSITTGEYQAIGLGLQGGNPSELKGLQAELEATKTTLEGGDGAEIGALTGQMIAGNLLTATISSYLGYNAVQDAIQAKGSNVVQYHQPSYGKFSTRLTTSYWFGIPRNVTFDGLVMDVDRLAVSIASKDNSAASRLGFMASSGSRASAMEHLIPEQMFSTEDSPAFGVSAVKALALASAAGQKIWKIGQNNVAIALASISHSADIEAEIRNSVRAGKVATIHEMPVPYQGASFVGYTIIDPVTGAGAYKIGGGENGGILKVLSAIADLISWIALAAGLAISIVGFFALVAGLAPAILVTAGIVAGLVNAVATLFSFGLICRDFASIALFGYLFGVMAAFGVVFVLLGGLLAGLLGLVLAIASQASSVAIGRVTDNCS